MDPLNRTALYRRVSTQMQVDRDASLPEQQARQLAFVLANGGTVAAEYEDGVSGGTEVRDGLQGMIRDAKAKKFDTVVVYNSDRLFRDSRLQIVFRYEMRKLGIRLASVTEPFFGGTSGEDELMTNVFGAFAEYGRAKIRSESKRGAMGASRNKGRQYGQPPYGYGWVNRKERGSGWLINEAEAAWVRQIFAWWAEGMPQVDIVARLNALGVPPPSMSSARWRRPTGDTTTWPYSTISQMLMSRVYIGEVRVTDHLPKDQRPVPYRAPSPIWFPGSHAAIIDDALWAAVVRRFEVAAPKKGSTSDGLFVGGLLRCPLCYDIGVMSPLELHTSGPNRRYINYVCAKSLDNRRAARMGRGVFGNACDGYSISELQARHILSVYLQQIVNAANARGEVEATVEPQSVGDPEPIRFEVAKLPAMRARIKDMVVAGLFSIDEGKATMADIDRREGELLAEVARLEAVPRPGVRTVTARAVLAALKGDDPPREVRNEIAERFEYLIPSPRKDKIKLRPRA